MPGVLRLIENTEDVSVDHVHSKSPVQELGASQNKESQSETGQETRRETVGTSFEQTITASSNLVLDGDAVAIPESQTSVTDVGGSAAQLDGVPAAADEAANKSPQAYWQVEAEAARLAEFLVGPKLLASI